MRARCRRRRRTTRIGRLLRAVHDVRDFAQINRFAAEDAHHHVAHVLRVWQERAGFDDDFLVFAGQSAGAILLFACCNIGTRPAGQRLRERAGPDQAARAPGDARRR